MSDISTRSETRRRKFHKEGEHRRGRRRRTTLGGEGILDDMREVEGRNNGEREQRGHK
jgi:hypothetical protein